MTDDDGPSRRKTESAPPAAPLPGRIGDYRIVRKLGEGGMGVVYEAEQQHPKRPVALKVIRGGRYVDDHHIRLFQREAQTLARLKHPGIAAIYETGRTDEGQHFFAMELVRGESLTQHLRRRIDTVAPPAHAALTPAEVRYRLRLMQRLCEAVAYAHQRGVIHRDLKPANILVARDATHGSPSSGGSASAAALGMEIKILDFGLARITDTDVAMSTVLTDAGAVQGTIPYMSPEQVRGNPDEIDLRTDVYSLGVVLYEMLSGRLPLQVARLPLPEAARVICEVAPEPLATGLPAGRRLDADVATIVLKALEKEPSRRYQGASALAEEIERYLTDQPILARPPSAMYQLRKLMSRHRAAFGLGVASLVMLVGFAVAMTVQAERIARARDVASQEAETARQVSEFLVRLFDVSDPFKAKGNTITAREILDEGAERIERELNGQPLVQARLMDTMGKVYFSLGLYDRSEPLLRRSLAIREKTYGPVHPEVAESLTELGRTLQFKGNSDESVSVLTRGLEIRRKVLAPGAIESGWSRYYLGSALIFLGDYEEARRLLEEAQEILAKALGPDHWAVAWCVNDLGIAYENSGDYPAARRHYLEALRIKEKVYGRDHPDVAIGQANVAWILALQGDYVEARVLLERAIETGEHALGPRHSWLGQAWYWYGEVLRREGQLEQARSHLENSLSILRETVQPDSLWLAATLHSLGSVLRDAGDLKAAEARFQEALRIRTKFLPPHDPAIAESLEGYAALLRVSGRDAEAAAIEVRARGVRGEPSSRSPRQSAATPP